MPLQENLGIAPIKLNIYTNSKLVKKKNRKVHLIMNPSLS